MLHYVGTEKTNKTNIVAVKNALIFLALSILGKISMCKNDIYKMEYMYALGKIILLVMYHQIEKKYNFFGGGRVGWVGEWVSGESMSNLFKWRISGKVNIYIV